MATNEKFTSFQTHLMCIVWQSSHKTSKNWFIQVFGSLVLDFVGESAKRGTDDLRYFPVQA